MSYGKITGLAVAAGAIGLLCASPARADLLNLGASQDQMTFTSNGNGTISFTTAASGFTLSGVNFQSPTGVIVLTGSGSLSALSGATGTESGGIFTITSGGTDIFTFSDGSGDTVQGNVSFAGIKDGTSTPQFDVGSTFTVTSVSGTNAAFLNDFKVGSISEIDFTLNLTGETLTDLANDTLGKSISGSWSSGEIHPVPEPASLLLFGTGLLGLAALRRRRQKSQ